MIEQHTSGAERAAEHEATAEQRAEWERRLYGRAEELEREVRDLAAAAEAHGTPDMRHVAQCARLAVKHLTSAVLGPAPTPGEEDHQDARGAVLLGVTETRPLITPDRGDAPPFAAELTVDQPPHERPGPRRP